MHSQIVADAYKLYLSFGGLHHREIEAAMRANGYPTFSRRVFYDRKERGKIYPGWIRKFRWNEKSSEFQSGNSPDSATKLPSLRRRGPASAGGWFSGPLLGDKFELMSGDERTTPSADKRHRLPPLLRKEGSFVRSTRKPNTLSRFTPNSQQKPPSEALLFRRWLKRVSPNMNWSWPHLRYLMRKLSDVTRGKTKRLMIFMPPRHGKSELVTVHYPAYRLKKDPWLNVIVGSYNQKLANRFSRKIRTTLENATQLELRHQTADSTAETPRRGESGNQAAAAAQANRNRQTPANSRSKANEYEIQNPKSQIQNRPNSAAEWETAMGGGVRAVGVGAGITGYGGKLVIIDDPIKSRSEAESETYRNKTWEWFNDDLYTRLEPDASMILIQTRWHEDDLAGRLLAEMKNGGEHWEVVSLPAICEREQIDNGQLTMDNENDEGRDKSSEANNQNTSETISNSPFSIINSQLAARWDAVGRLPGDPLCPERFSIREFERIRRQLGEYSFSALYQQRPMPLEGGLFKKKWFTRIIDVAPAGLRWFRGYDLAISTKTSADYTASARVAIDNEGFLYISDVFRARVEYPEQRKFIIDRLRNERDTEHCIEDAIHAKAVIQDLRRDSSLARCAIKLVTVTNDKFTRALAWANRAEEGKVILVRGPWLNMFLNEVCSFPNAAHDDQVDAVSIAVQNIDRRKRQFFRF